MDLRFFIKGAEVAHPENWETLTIELAFTNIKDEARVRIGVLKWMAENARSLNQWFTDGMNGGPGIFEGPPLRIEVSNGTTTIVAFEGCVDLASAETTFTCDIVEAPAREAAKLDWLNDIADSVSFAALADAGVITSADYINVPYVINTIPNYGQVALLAFGMYALIKELEEIVEKTAALIAELTGDTSTTAATVGLSVGTVIADIVKITLYIAYLLAIIVALVSLIKALIDNLIQPLKYKKGMKVSTLMSKAASYLNIPWSSTILQASPYKNAVIIPPKSAKIVNPTFVSTLFGNNFSRKDYDDAKNSKATGYPQWTLKDLLLAMSDVFNANTVIRNDGFKDVLHFEVWDYFNNTASYILPDIHKDAPFEEKYGTNASELASNYIVSFMLDESEFNTFDEYEGTSAQVLFEPIITQNAKNKLMRNITEKRLQFSLGKRKKDFTVPEKVFNFFYKIAAAIVNAVISFYNTIIGAVNGIIKAINRLFPNANVPTIPTLPTLPASIIDKRLNAMLLENDFTAVPKLVLVDNNGYLNPAGDTYISAKYLLDNFHSHSFAISSLAAPNNHNQYLIHKQKEIPMCLSDYMKIRGNNVIMDHRGRFGRIDTMSWNPSQDTAVIDYRIKQQYTANLRQRFITNGN